MKAISLTFVLAALLLSGCLKHTPSQASIDNADHGPQPAPEVIEAAVREHYAEILNDPYTAQYIFREPYKGWIRLTDNRFAFGWFCPYSVNSRNGFGAYTGARKRVAFFRNGQLIQVYKDEDGSQVPVP